MYRQAYKCNLSEFTPIFTSISCPAKFDRAYITGQIGCKSTGMILNLIREAYNEFPANLTSISCLVEFEIQPVEFNRA